MLSPEILATYLAAILPTAIAPGSDSNLAISAAWVSVKRQQYCLLSHEGVLRFR
jgi:hypothetical protein